MMKFMFMMLFMTPLSFNSYFWLTQFLYFMLFFLFLLNFSFNYMYMYISYAFGCDLLSFSMILLSIYICSLMILASSKIYFMKFYNNMFLLVLILLLLSLFITFSSMNMFLFYLFFEMSLIPTLLLILGWGYQPERLQAGMYLLFYTMLASLPMMVTVFYLYKHINTLDFFFFQSNYSSVFMYVALNSVFLVKMPMYFLHLWLPKAHVEAPVSGSMILAGIMLKLGGYGLLRFMILFTQLMHSLNFVFVVISLMGGVLVSLMCLRQIDIKSLIAYSSVAHMGLVLSGIMVMNYWGFLGSLVMMISHGLCSSGLFCLANITYERLNSRSIYLNKGLINITPIMSLWWFLLVSSNMAAPPSFNLLGEILLINSVVSWSYLSMLGLMLISFFSAAYSLYLYAFTQHGKMYSGLYSLSMGRVCEYLLLILHWLPLNLLIMKSEFFLLWL
uniref:NADH-ubiquinone oxidoreductase chain 4 n=1 Tax=Paromalus flavicornis TaxID=154191 RepID=A0A0S2MPC3_9COLE|nr:NADH deshydrogenase subunit 4 [Paromalus flavicornis]